MTGICSVELGDGATVEATAVSIDDARSGGPLSLWPMLVSRWRVSDDDEEGRLFIGVIAGGDAAVHC